MYINILSEETISIYKKNIHTMTSQSNMATMIETLMRIK